MSEGFARELRRQCARKGSIAQLCKATGINRQQFNKYLAGQMLPGVRTLRKICCYLGVSEAQLMSGGPAIDSAPPRVLAQDHMLRDGFYRAYFPVHGHPELVARWLVQIRSGPDGNQIHTCRNRFRDHAALGFAAARIRYRGLVTYRPEEASLIGMTQRPKPMQGVISVDLCPSRGEDCFSALVLTRRPSGPLALSGALHFLGAACTGRQALAGMGVFRFDDPTIDPVIRDMLRGAPVAGANWLQSINERNLQPVAGGFGLY